MKVLQLISSTGCYGAEQVILNLLSMLNKNNHYGRLAVIGNSVSQPPEIYTRTAALGIQCDLLPCRNQFDADVSRNISEIVKNNSIDIIHSHGYKADFYSTFLNKKIENIKRIATVHLWTGETIMLKIYEWLDRHFFIKKMDYVLSVSPLLDNMVKQIGIPEEKRKYVPNAIDTEKFKPNSTPRNLRKAYNLEDKFVMAIVGRLAKQKGHSYLLKAFKRVLDITKNKNMRLLIVGDGYLNEELREEVEKLGIKEYAIFCGFQKDMQDVMCSLDLFLLPSLDEGLPMALLEAMSSGLPAVASRVGAVPNVLGDKEGRLVNPASEGDLVEAIIEFLNDDVLRKKKGEAARKKVVSEFSLQTFYSRHIEIYRDVLTKNGELYA